MLDISKRCTDSVSWHWMEQQAETSDLVFIMCWLFVKVAHIQENTALMASSWLGVIVGFCTSINQGKKEWWETAKQLAHIPTENTTKLGFHQGSSKTWRTTGVGGVKQRWEWSNMLYYARESRRNAKCCRRLHPSLADAFIRRRQDARSNELVISVCVCRT